MVARLVTRDCIRACRSMLPVDLEKLFGCFMEISHGGVSRLGTGVLYCRGALHKGCAIQYGPTCGDMYEQLPASVGVYVVKKPRISAYPSGGSFTSREGDASPVFFRSGINSVRLPGFPLNTPIHDV